MQKQACDFSMKCCTMLDPSNIKYLMRWVGHLTCISLDHRLCCVWPIYFLSGVSQAKQGVLLKNF